MNHPSNKMFEAVIILVGFLASALVLFNAFNTEKADKAEAMLLELHYYSELSE